MTELIGSWPWYDRLIVAVSTAIVLGGIYFIQLKLDRIIKLLERANELEGEKQLRQRRPDLFE